MIFDLEGREKQALSMFVQAAEKEGYVLAAPKISDTTSISSNMVKTSKVIHSINRMLPIHKERVYTAGASTGARFANLVPIFLKDVKGTVSIGASVANTDVLSVKRPFHFIGIVDENNYNYTQMLAVEKILDRFRFPNQVLIYESDGAWPDASYLKKSYAVVYIVGNGKKIYSHGL